MTRDARALTYLGMDLAGARNLKTALAVLQHFPRENKTFLLDVYDRIAPRRGQNGDEALLELLEELRDGAAALGVDVGWQLPPGAACSCRGCAGSGKPCTHPSTRWMHAFHRKHAPKSPEPTPYTQRPVELWVRHQLLPRLPDGARFDVDETLGGTRAPLVARMHWLSRRLAPAIAGGLQLREVWPKLSFARLAHEFGLGRRIFVGWRHLEDGVQARETFLQRLVEEHGVFIYDRDLRKLAQHLPAFDAFLCAYTALLADRGACARPPAGFPVESGWVTYPA